MQKTETAADGSKIVQRGLVLLVLMTALAAGVLTIMLRRYTPTEPTQDSLPRNAIACLAVTSAAFPAAIPWAAVCEMGDALPSAPGWEIRYTATRVLANRGSPKVPVSILCEMLDEHRQLRNFQARLADGRMVPDEGAAAQEVVIALKAVMEWHKHKDAVQAVSAGDLRKLSRSVEKLTHSENNVVRTRARETMLTIKGQ